MAVCRAATITILPGRIGGRLLFAGRRPPLARPMPGSGTRSPEHSLPRTGLGDPAAIDAPIRVRHPIEDRAASHGHVRHIPR